MVRVSSPGKLRPWSDLTAKMVMGVVSELLTIRPSTLRNKIAFREVVLREGLEDL